MVRPARGYVQNDAGPVGDAVVRKRPRHRWNDADLTTAAILARAQCDIERLRRELATEGILTASGTFKPKYPLLETLSNLSTTLIHLLRHHPGEHIASTSTHAKTHKRKPDQDGETEPTTPTLLVT